MLLLHYNWPGNIRELRNVIETLCLLRSGRSVRAKDLPQEIRTQASPGPASDSVRSASLTLNLDDGLAALIQQLVEAALTLSSGNTSQAAARLRISPRTVQRYVSSGRAGRPLTAVDRVRIS
jgi:DNA-binding NtrC family response regulator